MSLLPLATQYVGSMKIFGWIAIAMGWIMNLIYEALHAIGINNIGVAIIIFTFLIYLCMLPLTYKQQKFSKLMKIMQPELKALQEKYKDAKDQASQQKMMEEQQDIYAKYGVSTTGSCVQSFLSILFLFPLYRVIYNVPAYVSRVKNTLMPAVEGIMSTDGYQSIFDELVSGFNISLANIGVSDASISGLAESDIPNRIVDILYKLSPDNWDSLTAAFSSVDIAGVETAFNKINNFCMLNITNSPWYIMRNSFSNGQYLLMIIALMVPLLATVTQYINIKLTPQSTSNDPNDATAQQMKMMNATMPLMSLFFCFTLPVGLGIYWISGAVIRCILQVILNRHFEKIDVEDIIEKNKEKAAKKKEKRGINQEKILAAAQVNTKNIKTSGISEAERTRLLDEAAEIKKDARKGSMAQRAAMVKEFNERNSRKGDSNGV